eukprot:917179-Prymnesium_polylepis.1
MPLRVDNNARPHSALQLPRHSRCRPLCTRRSAPPRRLRVHPLPLRRIDVCSKPGFWLSHATVHAAAPPSFATKFRLNHKGT